MRGGASRLFGRLLPRYIIVALAAVLPWQGTAPIPPAAKDATTIRVSETRDLAPDGGADGACSLRAAVVFANGDLQAQDSANQQTNNIDASPQVNIQR